MHKNSELICPGVYRTADGETEDIPADLPLPLVFPAPSLSLGRRLAVIFDQPTYLPCAVQDGAHCKMAPYRAWQQWLNLLEQAGWMERFNSFEAFSEAFPLLAVILDKDKFKKISSDVNQMNRMRVEFEKLIAPCNSQLRITLAGVSREKVGNGREE